jgi:hypothetical protein
VISITKRYYPIVENFDNIRGLELEGPLATISACKAVRGYLPSITETKIMVKNELQQKVCEDERLHDGEYLLKVKTDKVDVREWEEGIKGGVPEYYIYTLECDVYKISRSKSSSS